MTGYAHYFSKSEVQPGEEYALARQFRVHRQRVQSIILISQIQNAYGDLASSLSEAIADQQIELYEIISRPVGRVANVGLLIVTPVASGEESRRMTVENSARDLM